MSSDSYNYVLFCRYRVSKILYVLHRIIIQIHKRTLNKHVDRLVVRTAIGTLNNMKNNWIIVLSRNSVFSVLWQRYSTYVCELIDYRLYYARNAGRRWSLKDRVENNRPHITPIEIYFIIYCYIAVFIMYTIYNNRLTTRLVKPT